MAKSHHDKIAVISGGASGIGQAFAQRLAQDGAHIVIADVAPAGDTVKMVEQAGRHALACKCDVSSEVSVKALADQVTKRFSRCDIVKTNTPTPPPCRRSSDRKCRPISWARCRS
jgi:NAD(P)-dependent dehydrogenase (short-subunit alcohol dehydrogenase family)